MRTELGGVPFMDMKPIDENDRFDAIAKILKDTPGKAVAVMVDCGPGFEGKGDRYVKAIRAKVPGVSILYRGPGPVPNSEIINFKLCPKH